MSYFKKIKSIAKADGMPDRLATLIAAQAAHETGNFTSNVFRENNNAFGYKYVNGARYQISAGRISPEGNAYASYASLADSVHEVTAWIKRRLNEGRFPPLDEITTASQYAKALKNCGYYGDPVNVYANGISRSLQRYV